MNGFIISLIEKTSYQIVQYGRNYSAILMGMYISFIIYVLYSKIFFNGRKKLSSVPRAMHTI